MRSLVLLISFCFIALAGLTLLRIERAYGYSPGVSALKDSNQMVVQDTEPHQNQISSTPRGYILVVSLTVFVLSVFVGFEIINKVPPTLHTPLMSGSNAISGITVVGAMIIAGFRDSGVGTLLGLLAIVLAMINVVGGFAVTHRMLLMFKKR